MLENLINTRGKIKYISENGGQNTNSNLQKHSIFLKVSESIVRFLRVYGHKNLLHCTSSGSPHSDQTPVSSSHHETGFRLLGRDTLASVVLCFGIASSTCGFTHTSVTSLFLSQVEA